VILGNLWFGLRKSTRVMLINNKCKELKELICINESPTLNDLGVYSFNNLDVYCLEFSEFM